MRCTPERNKRTFPKIWRKRSRLQKKRQLAELDPDSENFHDFEKRCKNILSGDDTELCSFKDFIVGIQEILSTTNIASEENDRKTIKITSTPKRKFRGYLSSSRKCCSRSKIALQPPPISSQIFYAKLSAPSIQNQEVKKKKCLDRRETRILGFLLGNNSLIQLLHFLNRQEETKNCSTMCTLSKLTLKRAKFPSPLSVCTFSLGSYFPSDQRLGHH